jgi:uroporphyrinogen decarboxylase
MSYAKLLIIVFSRYLHCRVVKSAGPKGHILNLGHGVLQKTPEDAVAHFFDVTRSLRYDTLFQGSVAEELQPVA